MKKLERNPAEPKHGSGPVKQHPTFHPLHKAETDHRDMPMKEKYVGDGPHIAMPVHQHALHHPHNDVVEKHMEHMKK
jgi:hypothetical protein